jgi:hypothetical protein
MRIRRLGKSGLTLSVACFDIDRRPVGEGSPSCARTLSVEGTVGAADRSAVRHGDGERPGAVPAWRLARTAARPDDPSGPPWLVTQSDLTTNLLVVFVMPVGMMLIRPLVPPPPPPASSSGPGWRRPACR